MVHFLFFFFSGISLIFLGVAIFLDFLYFPGGACGEISSAVSTSLSGMPGEWRGDNDDDDDDHHPGRHDDDDDDDEKSCLFQQACLTGNLLHASRGFGVHYIRYSCTDPNCLDSLLELSNSPLPLRYSRLHSIYISRGQTRIT